MFVVPSYGSTGYFYDECPMITRILDTPDLLRAAFEPYNGHFMPSAISSIGCRLISAKWTRLNLGGILPFLARL